MTLEHPARSAAGCIGVLTLLCTALAAAQAPRESITVEASRDPPSPAAAIVADPTRPLAQQSFEALSASVANLSIDSSGAGAFGSVFVLRGVGNTPYFSDSAVSVSLDDLPLASSFAYPLLLAGYLQAGAVRGPQVSRGRAGEGGSLTFTLPEPGEHAMAQGRVAGGDYAARAWSIAANSAAGGAWDAQGNVALSRRDGYIRNTELQTRVDDQQHGSAMVRLRYRPSEGAQISLQVLANRQRDGAQPLVPVDGPRFTVARGREGSTAIDFWGLALKGTLDAAIGRLTSITSRTDWSMDPYDNRLVLPPPVDSRIAQAQRAWNQEFRLESVSGPWSWMLGSWLSTSDTAGDANRAIPGLFPIEVSSFALRSRSAALFGEATLLASARWQLQAGARAESTRKRFERAQQVPAPGAFDDARSFTAWLPHLAAIYAIDADSSARVSIARGAKAGGWSAYTARADLAPFASETLTAYELSASTRLPASALTLTGRAFYYALRDYQIERSFNQSDYLVVNAPRARSVGGELELSWLALPTLQIDAAAGMTRVTLLQFQDPFSGVNFAGHHAPYAPAHTLHLGGTWQQRGWFLGADLAAVGRTYFDEANDPTFRQRAGTVLNARAGYQGGSWGATLSQNNLTNAAYDTLRVPGVSSAVPGAPRTWGVEAWVKLGD